MPPDVIRHHNAIAIARDASPALFDGEPVVPDGMQLGDPVVVLPDEYGAGGVATR